jgi:hypothetical protein
MILDFAMMSGGAFHRWAPLGSTLQSAYRRLDSVCCPAPKMLPRDVEGPRVALRPGVVVIGVVALFVVSMLPLGWLTWRSSALGVLMRLGVPESATDVSDIDDVAADGNMPEWATRSFRAPGDPGALYRFFLDGCQRLGLSVQHAGPASSEEGDMWCQGSPSGVRQKLSASIRCEAAGCSVFVHVVM